MSKFEDDIARGCLESGEPLDALYGVGWWTEMPEPEPDPVDLHIAELEARIAELEARQRWIPVSERLPEDGAPVLVHFNVLNDVIVAYHDSFHPSWETGGDWNYVDEKYDWATHWMPLPKPPEEYQHEPA